MKLCSVTDHMNRAIRFNCVTNVCSNRLNFRAASKHNEKIWIFFIIEISVIEAFIVRIYFQIDTCKLFE